MTDPLDHAPEPDDRPAGLSPAQPAPALPVAAAPIPQRPRPSAWGRVFRWWLGLSLLAFVGLAVCAFVGLGHVDHATPLNISITDDGSDNITLTGLTDGGRALLSVAAGLLAVFVLLLVPLLLVIVLGSVAIALVCGIGVPLLALALVLGVLTSPFWLVALLVWLAGRRRETNRLAASATMPA